MLFDKICRKNGITHRLTARASPTTTGKICENWCVVLHRAGLTPANMTMVSCVRFVGRPWCSIAVRAGQADLT